MTEYPNTAASTSQREVLSVSQLNRLSRQLLETHFPLIWIEGELSNVAQPSSGHWYFTLKDNSAQVRCAMFRTRNRQVGFNPQQGQQILLRARVSLYEGRGDYQLIAEHMEEAGFGALQRAFEALKNQLAAEGLFAPERKRPLPAKPRHIAVITSPTGAAVRDVLAVLRRRYATVPVTVVPVPVQGSEAASSIVKALALTQRAELFDVIILTRGGGSLEDLWPFNEQALARAIAACKLPVISAVGHEVDFSIADFVADVRAPTPSAAAELAVPDAGEHLARLHERELALGRAINNHLLALDERLQHLHKRLRHPGERLTHQTQRLDQLELRLTTATRQQAQRATERWRHLQQRLQQQNPKAKLPSLNAHMDNSAQRLKRAMAHRLEQLQTKLGENARLLNGVSPLNTLERGYALVTTEQGAVLRSTAQTAVGQRVQARLAHGELTCQVLATTEP